GARVVELARRGLFDPLAADGVFLCGPGEMIDDVSAALKALGVEEDRIRFERFTPSGETPTPRPRSAQARQAAEAGVEVEVLLDGVRRSFPMGEADATVLDAAHRAGLEIPY